MKPMLLVGFAPGHPAPGGGTGFRRTLVLHSHRHGHVVLGGARLRNFALCASIGAIGIRALVFTSPYRLAQLTGFLSPWQDSFIGGFQLTQSLIAISQEQLFGVGLGRACRNCFYLRKPADFRPAVTAEEFGLAGSVVVIALYLALTWRAVVVGRRAVKRGQLFGAYLAYGIGIWIGLQAFINMGVNMGVLPTKGLTLPLMSYGGSSLIITCAAIGLLLRVDRETRESGKWKDGEAEA